MRLSTFSVVREDYVALQVFVLILRRQPVVDLGEQTFGITAQDCIE